MKNKILSMILIMTLIVFIMTVSVNALSFTATITPSATTVAESTEFIVTVKVSNLDVGTNGINGLTGYLKYDTDVFETISESSIEGLNSWTPKLDETTGKISLIKNNFVTSAQEVFQITLKTKSDVSGKTGTISYSNISASNSETTITANDISTSITVGTPSVTNTQQTNTTSNISVISANTSTNTVTNNTLNSVNTITNNTVNNAVNNMANNAVSSYVNTLTNTTSESDMPKTGVDDTILKVMFVVIVVALVFYIKIEKINKDMK